MKKFLSLYASLGLACLLGAAAARAQSTSSAAPTGIQAECIKSLDEAEKKLVALAEATPQEKYSWRPMEGVRSTGEVFAHVAAGNYGISTLLGVKIPEGISPREISKISEKGQVVEALHKSFAHARQAILSTTDLDKQVKIFGGRDGTAREVMLLLATHAHEHLGQSIAYARMNGIAPPWTAEREQEQKPPAKKP